MRGLRRQLKDWRNVNRELASLKTRVQRLECKHEDITFSLDWVACVGYMKQCNDCGAVLEHYKSESDMLKAKLEFEQENCREKIEKIKGEIESIGEKCQFG